MIAGIFHEGSGLGNQLHRYVATRVFAKDKGLDFGMVNPEKFKGRNFMSLDMGKRVSPVAWFDDGIVHEFHEAKVLNEDNNDIRPYDKRAVEVEDNTIIDGEFQGEQYFEHRLGEIREWLKVEPLEMPDDLCIVNFRGGEYVGVPDLFLPESYWQKAINQMVEKYPNMTFEVHTDDHDTARALFPWLTVVQDMERNWKSIRYAKHLILSNSSFGILPALLNEDVKEVIAPEFWAGHNKGYWQHEQNKYKKFTYIHG